MATVNSLFIKEVLNHGYPFHKLIWEAINGEEVGDFYKVIHVDRNRLNERSNLKHVFKDTIVNGGDWL